MSMLWFENRFLQHLPHWNKAVRALVSSHTQTQLPTWRIGGSLLLLKVKPIIYRSEKFANYGL
jgi:hypothetical protein